MPDQAPTRERLIHALYEAAELEHNLMCTYLYAAFSLKSGVEEGVSEEEAAAVARWKRTILDVAIDEMGHLAAVWNITSAIGAAPRFGRTNFPLDPGYLPAGVTVKLAPFSADVLQHFIFLERPAQSAEPEGAGFESQWAFSRATSPAALTPMGRDYATVGVFYHMVQSDLAAMAERVGERALFCGDPALQLSPNEIDLTGAAPVRCLKSALAACETIIDQGEGAQEDQADSHFRKFVSIRTEFEALRRRNPAFAPALPAAHNPVLRPPPRPEGRVWIEDGDAVAVVDAGNAAYQLMLRFMAYSYATPGPSAEKSLAVDLAVDLMKAAALLGESAARRPAGPANPHCNAGLSFTALRDGAALPHGTGARAFFVERADEIATVVAAMSLSDSRVARAGAALASIAARARAFATF
jgi:hypothetical protein